MKMALWKFVNVIICSLTLGILGLIFGAIIGGNFAVDYQLTNIQGYEATGKIGFVIGAIIGALLGEWKSYRKKQMEWEK
jgi:hypothetical protein